MTARRLHLHLLYVALFPPSALFIGCHISFQEANRHEEGPAVLLPTINHLSLSLTACLIVRSF